MDKLIHTHQSGFMKGHNYILKEIDNELAKWNKLPDSSQTHLATIKRNVLPCINILSMMILLSPPGDYWNRIDEVVCEYIFNNGHPKLKLSVLQRSTHQGGLWLVSLRSVSLRYLEQKPYVS